MIATDESNGPNNAYYFKCERVGLYQSYRICLMMNELGAAKAFATCREHIVCGECPAIAMRKEELAAGEAIYFTDYDESFPKMEPPPAKPDKVRIDKSSDSYQRGFRGETVHFSNGLPVGKPKPAPHPRTKPAPQPKSKKPAAPASQEAQLVEILASREATTSSRPMPGETPLQYAKRLRAQREAI